MDRIGRGLARFRETYPDAIAPTLVVAGGVAANKEVRRTLDVLCVEHRFRFLAPPHHLCTDNAVMIAWAGLERMALGMPADELTVQPRSRWPLDSGAQALLAYAGAFGTALASVIAQTGNSEVVLLGRDPVLMADLFQSGVHDAALPGIHLPARLCYSARPQDVAEATIVLFAMPSQAQLDAARVYGAHLAGNVPVVVCAKGIEKQSTRLLTDVLEEALPDHPIAMLSGPGFAADIAR
eukprot:gene57613-78932_t